MDNSEIAKEIAGMALRQIDFNQVFNTNFSNSDAETLGKQFAQFYQAFYKGVLSALNNPEQIHLVEEDEAKLPDIVSTKTAPPPAPRTTRRSQIKVKQSKLNDVLLSRERQP